MLCRRSGFGVGFLLGIGMFLLAVLPCMGQDSRVWITVVESDPGPSAAIESQLPSSGIALDGPIIFDAAIVCKDSFDDVAVQLAISGEDGTRLHEGVVDMPLYTGPNPVRFIWEPEDLADGAYAVQIAIHHPFIRHVAGQTLRLQKISRQALDDAIVEAVAAMSQVAAHVAATEADVAPAFARAQAAIGSDAAASARAVADAGDWPWALYLAAYAQRAAREVEAALAFVPAGATAPEAFPGPRPGVVVAADGALSTDGRPVILVGGNLGDADPVAMERLRRYGLNFASLDVAPNTAGSGAGLEVLLDAAAANGVAVAVSAMALDQPGHVLGADGAEADLNSAAARQATGAHTAAVSDAARGRAPLVALSVATSPRFSFGGEDVRAAFAAQAQAIYGSMLALNNAWRSNLRTFDDIGIWHDDEHLSYQHDWQTFHQGLAGRYMQGLLDIAAERAGSSRVTAAFGEEVLRPGEARHGVDHVGFVAGLPLVACVTEDGDAPHLALSRESALIVSLLRSMNPGAPALNLAHAMRSPDRHGALCRRAYVRSALWEDVIAGAAAVALTPWPEASEEGSGLFASTDPLCLEGAALAAAELNRLAPVVAAFQRGRAEVSIVWSPSSKIQNEGRDYLQSVRNAYEGCSYSGRKVSFISEAQIRAGGLEEVEILVLPRLMAVTEGAFELIDAYIAAGGAVIRTADPIPYTERGQDLQDVLTPSGNVVLIRGRDTAEQYTHAMDAIGERLELAPVVHLRNAYGYLLEGVRSAYAVHEGAGYLYILNTRHDPVQAHATHGVTSGRDLVQGRDVAFPLGAPPLTPMLIRLDSPPPVKAPEPPPATVPTAVVEPVVEESKTPPPPRLHHPQTGRGL